MSFWVMRGAMLLAAFGLAGSCCAELRVSLDENNFLVLEAESLELLAVEFQSPGGSLKNSNVSLPFQGVVNEESSWALYYNLGSPLLLTGSITLPIQWDSTGRNDVLFQYGTPLLEVGLQPIAGHELFAAQVGPDPVILVPEPTDSAAQAAAPDVIAWADLSGFYLYSEHPLLVAELAIQSAAGELIARGPFEFETVSQTAPSDLQLNSLAGVQVFGDYRLPIGWTGERFDDLTLSLIGSDGDPIVVEWGRVENLPEVGFPVHLAAIIVALAFRHLCLPRGAGG